MKKNEKLSAILNRDVLSKELNNDIPLSHISRYKYPLTYLLAEEGLKNVKEGDILFGLAALENQQKGSTFIADSIDYSLIKKDHKHFYYMPEVSQELMSPFLLQVEKDDNINSLLEELYKGLEKFISSEDISKIKKAIKDSAKRLMKQEVVVLGENENSSGFVEEMTSEELKEYDLYFNEDISVEKKSDDLDLVALKEMVLVLKGKMVSDFSIGFGFFGKVLPELKENGIDAFIFKVNKNKLSEIKLEKKENNENSNSDFKFGPVAASSYLIQAYNKKVRVEEVEFDDYFDGKKMCKDYYLEVSEKFFSEKDKFFVLTEGSVASAPNPKDNPFRNYDGSKMVKNGKAVKSAEVFSYEKEGKEYIQTRLYFVPYNPLELHLWHQDGEIVFGNNDSSLNSCSSSEDAISLVDSQNFLMRDNDKEDDFLGNRDKELPWSFSPAMIVAQNILNENKEDEEKESYYNIMTAQKHMNILRDVLMSLYGENTYTKIKECERIHFISWKYGQMKDLVLKLNKNTSDITKRLHLPTYIKEGKLSKEKQRGYFDEIAYKYFANQTLDMLQTFERVHKIGKGEIKVEDLDDK